MKRGVGVVLAVSAVVLLAAGPSLAYYHPTLGRWVQRDPSGYRPQDLSAYQYVRSGPILLADPTEQYQDGLDLYAAYFVPNSTDPRGLGGGSVEREWGEFRGQFTELA